MSICIIPARGGSERIPRKNVRPFLGKPVIAWSVEVATSSRCFDRIIVSTDDADIATLATNCGAEVPYLRSDTLADAYTGTAPVIADAIRRLSIPPETCVCCLYATAPFVSAEDLVAGTRLLEGTNSFVFAATTFPHPVERALYRFGDDKFRMADPVNSQKRTQEFRDAWHDAGQFYFANASTWLNATGGLFVEPASGVVIPRYRAHDIDTEEDWVCAEHMMRAILLAKDA
jgi:pseudaminic acid cytidylyltransferase